MALTDPPYDSRFVDHIARELQLKPAQVAATARLLAEGATIPFLARYRKEATGSLDEVALTAIRDRLRQLTSLEDRRIAILQSLRERDLLTEELANELDAAETRARLEDLYAPHRPKRRTRATVARERGLEPLADRLLQNPSGCDPIREASGFVRPDGDVPDAEAALAGARDIIAERVNEHPQVRNDVREIVQSSSRLCSRVVAKKKADPEAAKYRDYFDWSEPLDKTPSHRLLALRRGEKEGVLRLRIDVPEERCQRAAERQFRPDGNGPAGAQVRQAIADGCERLLLPSLANETRQSAMQRAEEEAVQVFAANLRELLLASPLGQKRVLALDPGFRTGCKLVCLDAQGALLHHDVVHATGSPRQVSAAASAVRSALERHSIEAIAIGNGTASRETEKFIRGLELPPLLPVVVVNESGASVYSASETARREFPDHDVTVRGAVSIGRRLMDPLAELVKIDPKSIGVGQYQHDVDQERLRAGLDDCVEACVNRVGVEVNTASAELLGYVSGLNRTLAENIVAYRTEHGPFRSRTELMKVPRLGAKAYEQAAGFLRIRGGKNPLDASAVHPERYPVVQAMAKTAGCKVEDLLDRDDLRRRLELRDFLSEEVGLPTLQDILEELAKPGRDPRKRFEPFSFADGVEKPSDLAVGMRLPGIVTNVTRFGAFVDVGVHQDGLVHISQLADHFVDDPSDVVTVNQKVSVIVTEVDLERNRISLSMKARPDTAAECRDQRDQARSRSRVPAPAPAPSKCSKPDVGLQEDWFSQALAKGKS